MKTLVYIVTCVVMLSVISCTSRNKGGDDVQVLMKDSTVISAPQHMLSINLCTLYCSYTWYLIS